MLDVPTNGAQHPPKRLPTIRFGVFEADLHAGEVRKSGSRVKLQEQPFKVLNILLERPGELVTREELRSRIWPEETYGDFDHAVNVAVGKLRTALGDSADNPCYIETVPRRGYRFVGALEGGTPDAVDPVIAPAAEAPPRRPRYLLYGVLAVIIAGGCLAAGVRLGRDTAPPRALEFQRLTVRHGTVYSARFAPDGHNIIYSASWDGMPVEIFSTDAKFSGTRSLGLPSTALLAVSPSGELAVITSASTRFMLTQAGTLGQLPLAGGAPRSLAEHVEWADWGPDGQSLAIVRNMAGMERLEFPIGHVLYESTGWISHIRISPRGDQIAFLDHPTDMDDRGRVSVVDLKGQKQVLSSGWESEEGLAWSARGNEVFFSATMAGLQRHIYAVDLFGHVRLVFSSPGGVTLQDISSDGRLLMTRDEDRAGIMGFAAGATHERDLSWLDWSLPIGLSPDGTQVVFDEQGEQGGSSYTVAVRDLRGSPPVPLGSGMAGGFSPDGKWVAATIDYMQLVLLPTGAGSARHIEADGIRQYSHPILWMPDGKQLLFPGKMTGEGTRCFIQSVDGGKPRAITPVGTTGCRVSPDGKTMAALNMQDHIGMLYPLDGGSPRPIPGLQPEESFEWTSDPNFMYVSQWRITPAKIYRLNLATGQRQLFKEVSPLDEAGLCELSHIEFSADGKTYIYGFTRLLSDLYLVEGIK